MFKYQLNSYDRSFWSAVKEDTGIDIEELRNILEQEKCS